jgi:hypothetical protein
MTGIEPALSAWEGHIGSQALAPPAWTTRFFVGPANRPGDYSYTSSYTR